MKTRHATRTVLLDNNNQIAILHVKKLGYYKIPGGGIEEGEKGKVSYEDHEIERGFSLEWCESIDDAVTKIEGNPVSDPDAATLQARDLRYIKKAQELLDKGLS